MGSGHPEQRTHDCKRHDTTSLFVVLDVASGKVIDSCQPRRRSVEFRKCLDHVEAKVPDDLDIHIVMDNDATHKTEAVRNGFAERPRWNGHFTPVSASWINPVERFFAELTQKRLRRDVHRSVEELEARILAWIETFHADPNPFRCTRSADDFLASRKRCCVRDAEAATIEKTPWAAIQHKGPNWRIGTLGRFCPQLPLNLLSLHGVVTRKLALLRDWESDFHRRNGQLPIFGVGDQNSVHEARIASTGIHCWSAFLEILAGQEGRGWARRIGLWTKTEVCRQAMVTVRQMRDA